MNLSLTFYSVLSLCAFLLSGNNEDTLKTSIFHKSVLISKECDSKVFQTSLDAYNEFYDNKCKQVKLKLGDISLIEQKISEEDGKQNITLVYNEVLQMHDKEISLEVELVEIYFYNKRKTSVVKLTPSDIKESSKRGGRVKEFQKHISSKSEDLLNHVLTKVSE